MKYGSILIVILVHGYNTMAQNNIIPNFNFEIGQTFTGTARFNPACNYSNSSPPGINAHIEHWRIATHNNDDGSGSPDWYDAATCGTLKPEGLFGCTSNLEHISRFMVINSEVSNCRDVLPNQINHEAIRVSLENNAKFKNNTTYIIRYKIMPSRARVFGGTNHNGGPSCLAWGDWCHIRFFLSELGQNWNNNNSAKQEITTANFNLATPTPSLCSINSNFSVIGLNYSLQEREFTTNSGNYTTLVIYAERGGAMIDDVEIFEKCETTYLIQNQIYSSRFYGAGKINFNSNFYEKSSDEIIAGSSVTNTKQQGNVVIKAEFLCTTCPSSFVNYTAPNKIILKSGFKVENGAHFRAILASCPNNLSRPANNDGLEGDPISTKASSIDNYLQTTKFYQTENKFEENPTTFEDFKVDVYPNLTTGNVNINMLTKLNGNYNFTIEELAGKILLTQQQSISQGYSNLSLSLSDIANGLYVLKIFNDKGVLLKAEKIILQK